eukprot:PhM_4_TR11675/c2_g1_i1/m.13380
MVMMLIIMEHGAHQRFQFLFQIRYIVIVVVLLVVITTTTTIIIQIERIVAECNQRRGTPITAILPLRGGPGVSPNSAPVGFVYRRQAEFLVQLLHQSGLGGLGEFGDASGRCHHRRRSERRVARRNRQRRSESRGASLSACVGLHIFVFFLLLKNGSNDAGRGFVFSDNFLFLLLLLLITVIYCSRRSIGRTTNATPSSSPQPHHLARTNLLVQQHPDDLFEVRPIRRRGHDAGDGQTQRRYRVGVSAMLREVQVCERHDNVSAANQHVVGCVVRVEIGIIIIILILRWWWWWWRWRPIQREDERVHTLSLLLLLLPNNGGQHQKGSPCLAVDVARRGRFVRFPAQELCLEVLFFELSEGNINRGVIIIIIIIIIRVMTT